MDLPPGTDTAKESEVCAQSESPVKSKAKYMYLENYPLMLYNQEMKKIKDSIFYLIQISDFSKHYKTKEVKKWKLMA